MEFTESIFNHIQERLKDGYSQVTFFQFDGQPETIRCTQNLDIIPKDILHRTRLVHSETYSGPASPVQVADLTNGRWRTLDLNQIISFYKE